MYDYMKALQKRFDRQEYPELDTQIKNAQEELRRDMDAAYEWFAAARGNGHAYAEFFMKRMERGEQEPPSVLLSATRLLYHMGNIFRDNAPAPAATGVQIDRKRLARLRQKRVALGHKPDDHEPEQQQGFSMKFHM